MIYVSITNIVLISWLEKNHSIIEMHRLKNVIYFQKILSFVLSRKIINFIMHVSCFKRIVLMLLHAINPSYLKKLSEW